MTHQDQSINQWIQAVNQAGSTEILQYSHERSFEVFCGSDRQAMEIYRQFESLGLHRSHYLKVMRGDGRLFRPALILNNGEVDSSIRAMTETMSAIEMTGMLAKVRQSPELTRFIRQACGLVRGTMFIYRADTEMILEAAIPDITEARLNKPIKECLGKSINVLSKKMADRRRSAISQVIEIGKPVERTYDYIWAHRKWDFIESYRYFPASDGGTGHVIITVMDPDTPQGWEQRGHFHNMINNGLAIATPTIDF